MSYTGIHQYKLLFDLKHQTFWLASAATREIWFIVIYLIVASAVELLSQQTYLKKQTQSAQTSTLQHHHTETLTFYIKEVFFSGGFTDE
jgi:archaellum component FlaG (FlaF/FlaG flagellin family)